MWTQQPFRDKPDKFGDIHIYQFICGYCRAYPANRYKQHISAQYRAICPIRDMSDMSAYSSIYDDKNDMSTWHENRCYIKTDKRGKQ